MSERVMLKNVRIDFYKSSIWIPQDYENNGKFRRTAYFVIQPGSENDKLLTHDFQKEAEAAWGKSWKSVLESVWGRPKECAYIKGDLKDKEGYTGMMCLTAHRRKEDGPVKVIDRAKGEDGKFLELTVDDGRPYPGCYVNALVEPWCQKKPNVGVRCKLITVQFVKDGDAFGGGGPATADGFEEVVDEWMDDWVG